MVKDRVFKKEYAPELMRIAENDLVAAEALAKDAKVRRETVLFQVQQAIEKALKALLCFLGKPVPMVHDLELIMDRLGSVHTPPQAENLADLSDFASIRRYEEGTFTITPQEVEAALKLARSVVEDCLQRIIPNA
jgi:HEPN domain-containing protein